MLRQVGLLAEALSALRARIWTRLDVNAAVLQERALLLELLLADRTANVQRHARRPSVLDHIGQHAGALHALVVQVLQLGQIRAEHRVITFGIFEIGGELQGAVHVARRRETGARLGSALGRRVVVEILLVLRLDGAHLGAFRVRHVLRP